MPNILDYYEHPDSNGERGDMVVEQQKLWFPEIPVARNANSTKSCGERETFTPSADLPILEEV